MKWVTRELLHFDRLISAWLISRFIDPNAQFVFLPGGQEYKAEEGATPFGLLGGDAGAHDPDPPIFTALRRKFGIDDPALDPLGEAVTQGVSYILRNKLPDASRAGQLVIGLMAFCEGLMMTSRDDEEAIRLATPLLDGLYAMLRAEMALAHDSETRPAGVPQQVWQTMFFSAVAAHRRSAAKPLRFDEAIQTDAAFRQRLKRYRGLAG